MRNNRVTYIVVMLLFSASLCTISDARSDSKPKVTVSVSSEQPTNNPQQLPPDVTPLQLPPNAHPQRLPPNVNPQHPPQGALDSVLNRISSCTPKPEMCNRKDDDCDGIIDNNIRPQSCTPSAHMHDGCYTAHTSCINGQTVCDVEQSRAGEVCNDKDDDCDGIVDNNLPSQTCFIDLNQGYGRTVCHHGNTYCRPNVRRPGNTDCDYNGDCLIDRSNLSRDTNDDEEPPQASGIKSVQGSAYGTNTTITSKEGDDCSKANFIEPGKFPLDLEGYKDDITLSCGTHSSADRFYQLSIEAGKLDISFDEKDSDAVWALYEGSCGSMHEVFCGKGTTPHLKSNVYYIAVEVPPHSATPRSVITIKYMP